MDDLKECPFCGGQATTTETASMWMVECNNAECGSNPDVLRPFKFEAIAAWNRRAVPQANAEQDALREIAAKLRRAGANLPAPNHKDAIFGATTNGLSIALLLVEDAIRAASKTTPSSGEGEIE